MSGIGAHHKSKGFTDEWLTPPEVLKPLGEFGLDLCSPIDRPWATAARHFTVKDNGLAQDWGRDRVWLNPPYGHAIVAWMRRMAHHCNGMALVFARTETEWFQRYVFEVAIGLLFLEGRLNFHHVDGSRSAYNAGGPTVIIAYTMLDAEILKQSGLKGHYCEVTK